MTQQKPIRRINVAVETLKKIFLVIFYLVLSIIIFVICWFEFKPGKEGYDVTVRSRMAKGSYYGIFYKETFEVWEIKNNEDGSSQISQIFPR